MDKVGPLFIPRCVWGNTFRADIIRPEPSCSSHLTSTHANFLFFSTRALHSNVAAPTLCFTLIRVCATPSFRLSFTHCRLVPVPRFRSQFPVFPLIYPNSFSHVTFLPFIHTPMTLIHHSSLRSLRLSLVWGHCNLVCVSYLATPGGDRRSARACAHDHMHHVTERLILYIFPRCLVPC